MKIIMTLALLSTAVIANVNAEAQATRLVNPQGQPATAKASEYQVDKRWQHQSADNANTKGTKEKKWYEGDRRWQHHLPQAK